MFKRNEYILELRFEWNNSSGALFFSRSSIYYYKCKFIERAISIFDNNNNNKKEDELEIIDFVLFSDFVVVGLLRFFCSDTKILQLETTMIKKSNNLNLRLVLVIIIYVNKSINSLTSSIIIWSTQNKTKKQ